MRPRYLSERPLHWPRRPESNETRPASSAQLFAALDREQPVQSSFNGGVTGGCSRPVSFAFDAMKIYAPALLLLLLAFPSLSSWAGETPEGSLPRKSASQESLKANAIYDDFKNRLEVALASRELAAVAALYRTNDVTAVELKSELARRQQPVAKGAKATPPYLKTLSELPPESHDYWEAHERGQTVDWSWSASVQVSVLTIDTSGVYSRTGQTVDWSLEIGQEGDPGFLLMARGGEHWKTGPGQTQYV